MRSRAATTTTTATLLLVVTATILLVLGFGGCAAANTVAVHSPFAATRLTQGAYSGTKDAGIVYANGTFLPQGVVFGDTVSPRDDVAIYVCFANLTCARATRDNNNPAIVRALLDSQIALDLGSSPDDRGYEPANETVRAQFAGVKCPLGFKTGRGFSFDQDEITSLAAFGAAGVVEQQPFRPCNQHRMGHTAFRFQTPGGNTSSPLSWINGLYVKTYRPGAAGAYLTGAFHQRRPSAYWVHPRDDASGQDGAFVKLRMSHAPLTPSKLEAVLAEAGASSQLPYLNQTTEADVYHLVLIGATHAVSFADLPYLEVVECVEPLNLPGEYDQDSAASLTAAVSDAYAAKDTSCDIFDASLHVAGQATSTLIEMMNGINDTSAMAASSTLGSDLPTGVGANDTTWSTDIGDFVALTSGHGALATTIGAYAADMSRAAMTAVSADMIDASRSTAAAALAQLQAGASVLEDLQATTESVHSTVVPLMSDVFRAMRATVVRLNLDATATNLTIIRQNVHALSQALNTTLYGLANVLNNRAAASSALRLINTSATLYIRGGAGNTVLGDSLNDITKYTPAQAFAVGAASALQSQQHNLQVDGLINTLTLMNGLDQHIQSLVTAGAARDAVLRALPILDRLNASLHVTDAAGEIRGLVDELLARETFLGQANVCGFCTDLSHALSSFAPETRTALISSGCGASCANVSMTAMRTSMHSALSALGVSHTAAPGSLRHAIDGAVALAYGSGWYGAQCDADTEALQRLIEIQDGGPWRRFFSETANPYTTRMVRNQVYPFDPTTDLLPGVVVSTAANLPKRTFGRLPPNVLTTSEQQRQQAQSLSALSFALPPKNEQIVYRIDIATFTMAGTFQAAAAKILTDATSAIGVPYNVVELAPLYRRLVGNAAAAYSPFELEPALDGSGAGDAFGALTAFIAACHELGIGVLVDTAEKDSFFSGGAVSAGAGGEPSNVLFQADWVWHTVDTSMHPTAATYTTPVDDGLRTYADRGGGANDTWSFRTWHSPFVVQLIVDAHDQFILRARADGVVHQMFGADTNPTLECIDPAPASAGAIPLGSTCGDSDGGLYVLRHYAAALAILQSSSSDVTEVALVYADSWPCDLRAQELIYHPDGPRPATFHTDTGRSVLIGCDGSPSCLFETIVNIPGVNGTRVNLQSLVYTDPTAYAWTMFPAVSASGSGARSLAPNFAIASDQAHAPFYHSVRNLGYPSALLSAGWLRAWQRLRLLVSDTPVLLQGYEALYGGWLVGPVNGGLGTSLVGTLNSALAVRRTHPNLFSGNSVRRVITPGRYESVPNGHPTALEQSMFDSVLSPGTQLTWMVSAAPGTCGVAVGDADNAGAVCDQASTVDVDGDGMPDVYDVGCIIHNLETYATSSALTAVPLVHTLVNNGLTDTAIVVVRLPAMTRPVILVGGTQQCVAYYNDQFSTPLDSPLDAEKGAIPLFKCRIPASSMVVFKTVLDTELAAPADLTLAGTERYTAVALTPDTIGLTTAAINRWLLRCPPNFDWTTHETCAGALAPRATTFVTGVRSGREQFGTTTTTTGGSGSGGGGGGGGGSGSGSGFQSFRFRTGPGRSAYMRRRGETEEQWLKVKTRSPAGRNLLSTGDSGGGSGSGSGSTSPCPLAFQRNITTGECTERRLGATFFGMASVGGADSARGVFVQLWAPVARVAGTVQIEFVRILQSTPPPSYSYSSSSSSSSPSDSWAGQLVSPNVLFNMTRDGEYVVLYAAVGDDLLADIDESDQPYVRLEYRYWIPVRGAGGSVTIVRRPDPYGRGRNRLVKCVTTDGTCAMHADPQMLGSDDADEDEVRTTILGRALPADSVVDGLRLVLREQWDLGADTAAAALLEPRIAYEKVPQLSLEFGPAGAGGIGNASLWRRQMPGSSAYRLLTNGYTANLSITDIVLTGMFSASDALAGSTFSPMLLAADLHAVRLGENEWRTGGVIAETLDGTAQWINEQPLGINVHREPDNLEITDPALAFGVVGSHEWNYGIYTEKRMGLEINAQLSLLEYVYEAHAHGRRVWVTVSHSQWSVHGPLFRYFAVNDTASPASAGGGAEFFFDSVPTALGATPNALRYSKGACTSAASSSCALNPRPDLTSPQVRQIIRDQVRMLLDEFYIDAILMDVTYLMRTDASSSAMQQPVPGAFALVTELAAVVAAFARAEFYVTDNAVHAPGEAAVFADYLMTLSQGIDLYGPADGGTRVLLAESAQRVVNGTTGRVQSRNPVAKMAIGAMPFVAKNGLPLIYQGQEFAATTGSLLPGLDPWDGAARWAMRASWTNSDVGEPPRQSSSGAFASSPGNQTAGDTLAAYAHWTSLYADGILGLSSNTRLTLNQNCTAVLSVLKWHGGVPNTYQRPVYVLLNRDAHDAHSTYGSLVMPQRDVGRTYQRVFSYGTHDCEDTISVSSTTDVYSCRLDAGAVVVYAAAQAYKVPLSDDIEHKKGLPLLGLVNGALKPLDGAVCSAPDLPPGNKDNDNASRSRNVWLYWGPAIAAVGVVSMLCVAGYVWMARRRSESGGQYSPVDMQA